MGLLGLLNTGSVGSQHPRENFRSTGVLATPNAEVVLVCDGCSSFAIDLRDTFSATFEASGTVDGTNWTPIPVLPVNQASRVYVAAITGTTQGIWEGACSPYWKIRVRCTSWTSGSAIATITASNALLDQTFRDMTSLTITATAAAGVASTLTLPAPGAGLRQYLSFIRIERHASSLLIALTTPTIITTTNLPTSLAFSIPAEAAVQGSVYEKIIDYPKSLAATAQNTAVTIVAPVATGVIWRLTAGYFVGA